MSRRTRAAVAVAAALTVGLLGPGLVLAAQSGSSAAAGPSAQHEIPDGAQFGKLPGSSCAGCWG